MSTNPLPIDLLAAIRTSSHSLRVKSDILIDNAAIISFLRAIDPEEWTREIAKGDQGIRMPLRFDGDEEELNIISILSLLNFLSGYRSTLHRLTSHGAWENVLTLVLSAHLSSSLLLTPQMFAASPHKLASLLQIQTHVEKPHPTLGSAVMVGEKDEEAWEILELACGVLRETGGVLKMEGKGSLGAWVGDKLVETGGDENLMLRLLAETFPAFNDTAVVDGEPVYFFKKALFLLHSIALRFGTADPPPPFPVPRHTSTFPIFADNVIPTMLVHHRILILPSSTFSPDSPALTPLSHESAARLRASAVDACSEMVRVAKEEGGWLEGVTEVMLDRYLWALGKKEDLRKVKRFEERGTVFY